ncbi:hypothetical protein ACFRJ9_14670 [Paenarthrobacter sp. NPDC056912]|uniref:hypothetical protein n=1 Tax=Paenarthrobacter sp. NPDC056912 TaxID=3345965 RepID=UPI0036710C0D
MPGDEHVNLSGYDGVVHSPVQTPFVPEGKSVWEFGVGGNPKGKADADYDTRTKEPYGVNPSDTTFVFVTPHRWANGRKWAQEKTALNDWKSVQVRTASDLYAALERSPRTHVRFSEEIGIPANGVQSLIKWWENFTSGTRGLLTPELLTAGRTEEAARLLTAITEEPARHLWIAAPDPDDVLSFVAAVVHKADPVIRQDILDRTLVVFDPGALAYLCETEGLLLLVPFEESLVRRADLVNGHHIILHSSSGTTGDFELRGTPIGEAEKILKSLGVEDDRVSVLARAINKSVPLYKRRLTGVSSAATVVVRAFADDSIARRSWMLGSWNLRSPGDVAAVERVAGSVEAFQKATNALLDGAAPIFTRVGSAWKIFDRQDSIGQVVAKVTADDLTSVEAVVQEILGAVDPKLELPRDERWKAAIHGKVRNHSSDLRKGLAATLAQFGSLEGDANRVVGGQSLGGWAQLMVRALLQRANEDKTGKVWESLLDVLSLLAEAAPDFLLEAVEAALEPGGALSVGMFPDSERTFLSPTSPHVYLQSALEVLAWSPVYFSEASQLIMLLAAKAPNDSISNHPTGVLAGLFLPWRPQTSASLKSRNTVLSKFVKSNPVEAWKLLLALFPGRHGFVTVSGGPEFHDWKERATESNVSMPDYVDSVGRIVDLGIQLARQEPSRLVDLVSKIDDLSSEPRDRLLRLFAEFGRDGTLDETDSEAVWKELTSFIRRHREYSDSQWALDEATLGSLDQVAELFKPARREEQVSWLFDYHPELGDISRRDNYEEYDRELQRRQTAAAEEVFAQSGLHGLLDLAATVRRPWSVGHAITQSSNVDLDGDTLAPLIVDERAGVTEFAHAAIAQLAKEGDEAIVALAKRHTEPPLLAARILRIVDDLPSAWEALEQLGEQVSQHYWEEFQTHGRGQFQLVNETARRLGNHKRYAAALDLMAMYSHGGKVKLDPELILDLIDAFSSEDPETGVLSQYDIGALLDYVERDDAIDVQRLGLLQWNLLPALDESASIRALESLLAGSADFFVQMISFLYCRGDEEEEPKVPENVSSNAWHLLDRWTMIPGSKPNDGIVDETALFQWVEDVRRLLEESGRLDVGEAHIGIVLARAKIDAQDSIWPCVPVRNFLEGQSSEVINRNFKDGIFNKRDATSRSLTEGGEQERVLAKEYRDYAAELVDEWPKTARLLREVAKGYEDDARGHDEEAQRIQEGFGLR